MILSADFPCSEYFIVTNTRQWYHENASDYEEDVFFLPVDTQDGSSPASFPLYMGIIPVTSMGWEFCMKNGNRSRPLCSDKSVNVSQYLQNLKFLL